LIWWLSCNHLCRSISEDTLSRASIARIDGADALIVTDL
jgi:hypothetical protein